MAFIKPRRSRLLVACILGIGLALLFVWPSTYVGGQEPGGRPVDLDIILLIDNSMSMSHEDPVTGAPPGDPEGLRIRAAKFLVDYLGANAETLGASYRVGVASFGGVVNDVVPLRLLQDDTVREGIHAEEIQFTDFRGPLQFALREFRAKSLDTGNKMATILLTGGRPQLTDAPVTEQELRSYFENLAPLVGEFQEGGASLFVLGIGDAQEDRDHWTRLTPLHLDHYIPITSTAELADVYHRIVAGLIGVAVSEGETIPAGQAAPIEVELYLERVVFSFVKSDPSIHIVLTSPTGAVLRPTIGGTADVHHSIYSITNPDAGEWEAFWEGEGEVRYWVDEQYPLIRVEPIESASLVGRPITITASLVRNNMIIVDPGLRLEAEIALPGGDVVTQALLPVGSGRYTGSHEDVQAEGTYTVTAQAILDGHLLSVRPMPMLVEVFPPPILPTLPPQPTQIPTSGVVTPMPTATPTPTARLVELLRRGPILIPIIVGLGIAFWFLYRRRTSSEREKELRERSLAEALDEAKKATRANLVVKPVTRWFPNNVGLGDVHVAWILHNQGPGSVEIHQIALYLGERELECDVKGEVLLPGDQRRVAFRLSKLAGSELPADLDLALAVSVTDEWERRTERVCYPHHGFEVLRTFRGRVIGQEIVALLQSNAPLTSDELRQYCLEAKLCVHCNQLALLQLLGYSGGYPLFVHILLDGLIRYLKDGERWKTGQPRYVTCAGVPEVIEYIVGQDMTRFPGLIARAWSTFPLDERAVIEALLESTQRQGGEPANLAQIQMCLGVERPAASILNRLETKGMVEKRDSRYRLRAKLLEEWLQARQERDRAP